MARADRQTVLVIVALLLVGLAAFPAAVSRSQNGAPPAKPKDWSVPAVVAAVRPSVVTILARGVPPASAQHGFPSGSGFIIDEKGYILTNNHLVEGVKSIVVGLVVAGGPVARAVFESLEPSLRVEARVEEGATAAAGTTVLHVEGLAAPILNGERTIELTPASAYVRRLQHEMVRQANLTSHSYGKEPYRRVRIYRE